MAMEQYVGLNTAKLLKAKGFKCDECNSFLVVSPVDGSLKVTNRPNHWEEPFEYPRATHQMVMEWLRQRPKIGYNVCVVADNSDGTLKYHYEIQVVDNELRQYLGVLNVLVEYNAPSNAAEAGILYCLENFI